MATDILNNLAEFDVVEEIDESALSTDQAPPPVKGRYQIRVSMVPDGAKEASRFNPGDRFPANSVAAFSFVDQQGAKQSHLYMTLKYEALNEAGNSLGQIRDWPNTMIGQRVRTSAIDTLLKVLTGRAGVGMSTKQKVEALYDLLASGPQIAEAEIDWIGEIQVADEKKSAKTGHDETKRVKAKKDGKLLSTMTNFPGVKVGNEMVYKPVTEDDDGAEVFTTWQIREWVAR